MIKGNLPGAAKRRSALQRDARLIFTEALQASSIERAFAAKVRLESHSNTLILQGLPRIDLAGITKIIVLAIGKAASPMLQAFLKTCIPPQCTVSGVLIAPTAPPSLPEQIQHVAGGHPLPNRDSFLGAKAALQILQAANHQNDANTFCFFLVSGGASAMMDLPLDPAIFLDDTATFHQLLVGSGASIAEINCVRKHFSAVKGGRLAVAAGALPTATLLISDVPEGNLDAISSGPTLPDSTTIEDCRRILERYALSPSLPPLIQRFFDSPLCVETPKPGVLPQTACVLLSSADLAAAAKRSAETRGYTVFLDHTCDDWNYRDAANYLLARVRGLRLLHRKVCLISAGEVTVQLPAAPTGKGGRNLHVALYSATCLQPGESLAILSAGSDGIDGNSKAAGAVVDAATLAGHREEANQALAQFASFDLLNRLGATIVTGPTGNNLRDLRLFLAD